MNRIQYIKTRRMIRENGRYALRYMQGALRQEWDHLLFNIQDSKDLLAERADIVSWCNQTNTDYSFRNLANTGKSA